MASGEEGLAAGEDWEGGDGVGAGEAARSGKSESCWASCENSGKRDSR